MSITHHTQATLAFLPFASAPGGNTWQTHHSAGRQALQLALGEMALRTKVSADPSRGFLKLTDPSGQTVADVFINVSHAEGMAVGVAGPAPIGIDVESLTRDPSRALERLLGPEDRVTLAKVTADPRVSTALLLWTAKEAFSKALGLGMQAGMPNLHVALDGCLPYVARTQVKGIFPLKEPRIHWEIRDNFLITVCTEHWVFDRGLRRIPG